MRVIIYPADQTGCGYYRMIWPAMVLKALGHDIKIIDKKDMANQFQGIMHNDVMTDVKLPEGADVVVFQRPTHKLLAQAIPLIRKKGIAAVVDMDDDLSKIDPRNPAFSIMHPANGKDHSWSNVQRACEAATLVTVSTAPLLDVYARKCQGVVLPNYVPHFFTQIPHEDSDVVGWGGSVHSHPDDLQVMGPAISRISREVPFKVVGPEKGLDLALGETVAARIEATGPIDFLEWSHGLTANLGIGVAPTADTKFNRAKSWLKPLEYMSVGVPAISSPRPEYVALMENFGVGLIASTPKDWYRLTMSLVRNGELRRELGESYRTTVMNHLTIERNAHRWAETWQLALDLERR